MKISHLSIISKWENLEMMGLLLDLTVSTDTPREQ